MKRICLLPLITMLFLFACKQPSKSILRTSNLTSSFINIDAGKDNTLKTPKGAIIKIAANSFDIPAGTKVSIEIKEAYSMQDILRAGLITTSNGRPLQSGGMIYFNATAAGNPVNFLKKVGITIPSKVYNDSMQVFTGELKADSTINWIEPKPLDSSNVSKELAIGKALFKANCASCHHPYMHLTGPALAGSRERAPYKEWPYKFINHSLEMIQYDEYAMSLKRKYGSVMVQFNLPVRDIKAILDYCDNEAWLYDPKIFSKKDYELPSDTASEGMFVNRDCGYDTIAVYSDIIIEDSINVKPDTVDNYSSFKMRPSYSFDIDYSGWYNIDCFMDINKDAIKEVNLTATITSEKDIISEAYLCVPSRKLLTSGHSNNDGTMVFGNENGIISLIKDDEAFVFVLGAKEDKFYYGITKFVIQSEQHLVVELKATTKEWIGDALRRNKFGDIAIVKDEPVIETFIQADSSMNDINGADSSYTQENVIDSSLIKKEMQVIKIECNADSINLH